jgi:PEP-CTERM motif
MKRRSTWVFGIGFLALAVLSPTSRGGAVTYGDLTLGNTNAFPFSGIYYDSYGGTRYQQVYDGTQFGTGAVAINSITFFSGSAAPNLADGAYLISLSTTTAAIGALDPNMANNVGSDSQIIFDGSLVPTLPADAPLAFTLNTPFDYNPANGNLLVDIQISGVTNFSLASFASQNGDFGTLSSRMVNGSAKGTTGYGLVTQFGFVSAAVPEPGTLSTVAIGVVGMAVFYRFRRRARA